MKRLIPLLIISTLFLCSCEAVSDINIPDPTESPVISDVPVKTQSPDPENIDVPETIDELSSKIGMKVYTPSAPPEGYSLTEIGFDGQDTAALKYTGESGTLLYTFTPYLSVFPTGGKEFYNEGFLTFTAFSEDASEIQWRRGKCTYQIFSSPQKSEEEMISLMNIMLKGPAALSDEEKNKVYDTDEALCAAIGFSAWQPTYLPEGATLSEISCYYLYSASFKYISESNIYTFRACEGYIPPYYDTSLLPDPATTAVSNMTVNVYYDEKSNITYASWTNGYYSYQITCETGVSKDVMTMMIMGFTK